MSRSRPRTSRVLLIVLGLTVAVGAVTITSRYRQNRAQAGAGGAGKPPVSTASSVALVDDGTGDAVVTQAPTSAAKPSAATAKSPTATTTAPGKSAATNNPAVVLSAKPLLDAKAKADAGKLLEARDIYNAALISGKLSEPETRAAKQALAAVNDTVVFTPGRTFETDPWGGTFNVPPGGVLAKIAKRFDITPELLQRINGISDPRRLRAGQTLKIVKGPLHAVVDKSDFTLDLYFGAPGGPGSSYVTTFKVGLGKDDSTPLGKWLVEPGRKLTNPTYYSPRGEGVIEGNDPKNPLGEHWIALTGVEGAAVGKEAYGIHGTIEPDSIGTMASMGCIRLRNEDVARVYEMLVEGKSTVRVVE